MGFRQRSGSTLLPQPTSRRAEHVENKRALPAVIKSAPRLPGKVCAELLSCYRAKWVSALHLPSQASAPRPTFGCWFWSAAVLVLLLPLPSLLSIGRASPSSRDLPCPWSSLFSLLIRGTGAAKLCCLGCATQVAYCICFTSLLAQEIVNGDKKQNTMCVPMLRSHVYRKPHINTMVETP